MKALIYIWYSSVAPLKKGEALRYALVGKVTYETQSVWFKDQDRTAQETQSGCFTKTSQLMLCGTKVAVCSETQTHRFILRAGHRIVLMFNLVGPLGFKRLIYCITTADNWNRVSKSCLLQCLSCSCVIFYRCSCVYIPCLTRRFPCDCEERK